MADLGQVLGAILSSLAHARRIADEETAELAEYYRRTPLLEGMSLPRIRVPELTVDVPVVMEDLEPGAPGSPSSPGKIREAVATRLMEASRAEGVSLPQATKRRFDRQLRTALEEADLAEDADAERREAGRPGAAGRAGSEAVVRAVETALHRTLEDEPVDRLTGTARTKVSRAVLAEAGAVAMESPRVPPRVGVIAKTAEVKEKASAENVVRLRLTLREEGLEWTATTDDDGTTRRFLTPE